MDRREPEKSRFTDRGRDVSGPAPPERKKKAGYYQRFAKEDANGPDAVSSSSRYDPQPNRDSQTFDQVKRPPDVSPDGWRQETPERPAHIDSPEEPGRLRFTPSDELNKGAGDFPHNNRQGQKQARRYADEQRPPEGGKTSRLHFAKGERPPEQAGPESSGTAGGGKTGNAYERQRRKTDRAEAKADRADTKLEKARDKLPTRRRVRLKQEADPATGKLRHRLRFEQEIKPDPTHSGPLSSLAAGAASATAYFGSEDGRDNIGVDATQTTGQTVEQLARQTSRFVDRHRAAPYAKVRKLEKQAAKANVNYLYRQSLQDHPELKRSPLSRLQQKHRIKRQYAKAAREAQRTARQAGTAAKETAGLVGSAFRAVASFAGTHKGAVAIGVLVVLIVFFFGSCTTSCASLLSGGFSAVFVPAYKAEDGDIEQSELQWTQAETQLQEDIDNAERDHPGFDEYRYELDEIGHDPFEIIAFLSAMYDDFLYADVSAVLQEVFNEVYNLQFIETVEVRYRTETDPETGEETEVPYNWYILTTRLTTRNFEEIIRPRLDAAEHGDMYEVYMDSLGGHQKYGNPFTYEWLSNVTCNYGYRQNPTGPGTEIHRGLDIGAPLGTPILSVQDGTVIQAVHGHASYGNYILIADDKGNETRYAHCSVLTATEGQKVKTGEKIAEVGSTGNSTGNHLHIEVKENGVYLNPLYMLKYSKKESAL